MWSRGKRELAIAWAGGSRRSPDSSSEFSEQRDLCCVATRGASAKPSKKPSSIPNPPSPGRKSMVHESEKLMAGITWLDQNFSDDRPSQYRLAQRPPELRPEAK